MCGWNTCVTLMFISCWGSKCILGDIWLYWVPFFVYVCVWWELIRHRKCCVRIWYHSCLLMTAISYPRCSGVPYLMSVIKVCRAARSGSGCVMALVQVLLYFSVEILMLYFLSFQNWSKLEKKVLWWDIKLYLYLFLSR